MGIYKEIEENLTAQEIQNTLQDLSLNESWDC